MKAFLAIPVAALLVGCAAPRMYNWGGYDQALYAGYKDVTKMDELRVKLEAHVTAMEASKQKVAPGLYAELGTLYLQSGSTSRAIGYYGQERQAWPESTQLMTSLIQNLERQQQTRVGERK
jgi:hypothetical protein